MRRIKTNLCHLIEIAAEREPASPALTYRTEQVAYGNLWRRVRSFAAGLGALGLQRNDRVAVFLEKRIETVIAIFGVAAAGGVCVPINPLLKPGQVAYILHDCSVRVLVTSPERLAQLAGDAARCPALLARRDVASRWNGEPGPAVMWAAVVEDWSEAM